MSYDVTQVFLTGVDEHTRLWELKRLTEKYPQVVWGVLFSKGRAGMIPENNDVRYPSMKFIENLTTFIDEHNMYDYFGLHICGKSVRDFIYADKNVRDIASYFSVIQLNFRHEAYPLEDIKSSLMRFSNRLPKTQFVTQYNEHNLELWKKLHYPNIGHTALIDFSGGNGIVANAKESIDNFPGKDVTRFGFAGGIGLDNVESILQDIKAIKTNRQRQIWIDMETKIRTYGQLDLDICEKILEVHQNYATNL